MVHSRFNKGTNIDFRILQLQQKFTKYIADVGMRSQKLDMLTNRLRYIDSESPSLVRIKEINPKLFNELKPIAQELIRVLENFKRRFNPESLENSD